MKRFASILKKRTSFSDNAQPNGDTPEAEIARGVRLFCESGGPNNSGDEVLHLPGVVDQAEGSPGAASEAARVIRKFLGLSNANPQRAYVQYNAVMLTRILADNPGKTFTRNIDGRFVTTVNKLLKDGKDMSVQQILRETLDNFQTSKSEDETLKPLLTMWQDYKAKMAKRGGFNPAIGAMQPGAPAQGPQPFYNPHAHRHHHGQSRHQLPPPHELASRIEEAKTSAKLLLQVVQSTPPEEVLNNDLLKEFVSRCQSASRSVQGYINCHDPAPDEDTLLTLIETNDQLSAALSRHQRAILQARKMASQQPMMNGAQPGPRSNSQSGPQSFPQPGPQPGFLQGQQSEPQITPGVGATIQPQAQYVPPAGPLPMLRMPKPQDRLENPFDDSNQAHLPVVSGAGPGAYKDGQTSVRAANVVDDDEEESPQQQRRYRF